ncbi:FCD domain-containing protein (plasmid) [Cereibacter azotoformans]|uniref:GntR family transcriptional regulator n=1 Tax=Cereibacter azotoformans TaxID=43057 RepID=A0A2T5JUK2_9RHOB|nr:FCD domain-containing protein [Cereibacter azotoformans]AXQ96211.1 FadR family transcriptional regulator [Cereibacter sphaeroides]PTR13850.1 GntR family transcriptional regulator [Cereibacter azotoformans]UIJ33233.1 FCD domain-containing protein [Cereibacter azotoformans]
MPRTSPATALERLRRLVDAEAPSLGDRLPTERALACLLGCSRQTVRAALLELERKGEIWRQVGKGTFRGPAPLGHPVKETILLSATAPDQLMQARLMIEPPIAAEAARRASARDMAYLQGLVARGRGASDRGQAETADAAFHRGVAEVAGNPLLLGFLDYLASARRRAAWQREWDRTYRRIGVGEFTGLHSDQHADVVAAIARADPPAAEAAMRRHLTTILGAMQRPDGNG